MSAVVAHAAQALTAPILSSPISARSRVRWAIIASKGSSMTAFTAWVRKRIGTSGAPGTRTIRDGYRMVTAFVRRRLGVAVNRKRVLRVMREHKLIQRRRPLERRKRPGFFRVERPRQLWQLDMTSVWVAEHGWCYLNAIIDCCTREIVGWSLELRCRADEAIAVVEHAAAVHGIEPGELVLGSDNGS